MCKALYLATDVPILPTDRDDPTSVFFVRELEWRERRVRVQFSKPELRHLGAHTGCSCGFMYDAEDPATLEEAQLARRSVEELRRFLTRQVEGAREVELYHCWEGDEDEPAKHHVDITTEQFAGSSFRLQERALYRVRLVSNRGHS